MRKTTRNTGNSGLARRCAVGVSLLAGLFAVLTPTRATAVSSYRCDYPGTGSCLAERDSTTIHCECADGTTQRYDVPELLEASDQGLADACWDAWTRACVTRPVVVQCEHPAHGRCEAGNDNGGRIDCQCADGSLDARYELDELDGADPDELEGACHEAVFDLCPAPEGPKPDLPREVRVERDPAGCTLGGGFGPSLAWLLVPAIGWRRRKRLRPMECVR